MLTLENKSLLFVTLAVGMFSVGGIIGVDVYESGVLVGSPPVSYVILSKRSCSILKPTRNRSFVYVAEGKEYSLKIVSVEEEGEGCRLIFNGAKESQPLQNITYKLKRSSLWSEVMGF